MCDRASKNPAAAVQIHEDGQRTFVILAQKTDRKSAGQPGADGNASDDPSDIANTTIVRNALAGRVRTPDGRGLEGVSITVKGTPMGTYTDAGGEYSLYANEKDILVFSFIGYKSKELAAGSAGVVR